MHIEPGLLAQTKILAANGVAAAVLASHAPALLRRPVLWLRTLLATVFFRALSLRSFWGVVLESARGSAVITVILAGSFMLNYAFTAEGDPNTGIVIGDDAVLVVDAQATPKMAEQVIERMVHEIRILKPTHVALQTQLGDFDQATIRPDSQPTLNEIVRFLAADPSIMLLDEPFAGIDPIAVGDIRALVRQLTARKIGVLITDHNVRETLGLIDRAYIIHSGQVLMEGTPDAIIANDDVRRVYLGEEFRL